MVEKEKTYTPSQREKIELSLRRTTSSAERCLKRHISNAQIRLFLTNGPTTAIADDDWVIKMLKHVQKLDMLRLLAYHEITIESLVELATDIKNKII